MNKKEQVVEWMQSLEIKQLLEYSKLDVQMIGDMVDSMRDIAEAPEDEKMEKAERPKEPLAFLKGGDSRQFLNLPKFGKVALWSFLKAIAGVTSDLEIRSFRLLGEDVYIRTQLDIDGTVGEMTFKMTRAEAEFCCGLQYASESNNIHHFADFFEAAVANQKAGVNRVRPEFLLTALNSYKPLFSIMEYADEPGIKEKFEFFKAQANKVNLSKPLDLMEEFPKEVERRMREEEDRNRKQIVMIPDVHMPMKELSKAYDSHDDEEDSSTAEYMKDVYDNGFQAGSQNGLYKLRQDMGEMFDRLKGDSSMNFHSMEADYLMGMVMDRIDQEIDRKNRDAE